MTSVAGFTGKDIVVIGGGNVAMDVARSAIRLGAKRVRIVYRRRAVDMTAMPEEVEGALEEGCEVLELCAPCASKRTTDGRVAALWVQPADHRRLPQRPPGPANSAQDECASPVISFWSPSARASNPRPLKNRASPSSAASSTR